MILSKVTKLFEKTKKMFVIFWVKRIKIALYILSLFDVL